MDEQERVAQRVADRQRWLTAVENAAYSALMLDSSVDEVRGACERGIDAAVNSATYRARQAHRVA